MKFEMVIKLSEEPQGNVRLRSFESDLEDSAISIFKDILEKEYQKNNRDFDWAVLSIVNEETGISLKIYEAERTKETYLVPF